MKKNENHNDNKTLKDKIAALTDELESVKSEYLYLNRYFDDYIRTFAHDLKEPVRIASGMAGILSEDYSEKIDNEGKRLLKLINSSLAKLETIIEEQRHFALTGIQEITMSLVNMTLLTRNVFNELADKTDLSNIVTDIKEMPEAYCDKQLIREMLVQLISNAVKFTSKNKNPRIETGGSLEKEEAVFYIKDNGAGFDMKYADKLFKISQRLHDSIEFEGNGMGLALVEQIISRHHGRVWAEGKTGEGAVFYFSLPSAGISYTLTENGGGS
jgi:light-regulated signal transduction histidine kinase (bacteriophytochrome)